MNRTKGLIGGQDGRLRRTSGDISRSDPLGEDADRSKDGTALTPDERQALLRQEWVQNILPDIPAKPGWHRCWLSTTNSNDPIYKRQQIGYVPVMIADVPGYESFALKGGAFDGAVHCNEMILFEIPMERHIDMMTIYHHTMPNEEEGMLKKSLVQDAEDSEGNELGEAFGDGVQNLGRNKRPIFAHI